MANRVTVYVQQDPILVDCKCGVDYSLFTINTLPENKAMRFLQECGRANFCPFCGRDYRTKEMKRCIEIQEGGMFKCPVCTTTNIVGERPIKCCYCNWHYLPGEDNE